MKEIGAIIVTDQNQQLILHQARTRLLLEQMPAIIWTTDDDLRVTSVVGQEATALGMTADRMLGRSLIDVVNEHVGLEGVLAAHYRALEGQRATYDAYVEGRVFHGAVESLRDESERIVGCVGLGLDVTHRRRIDDGFGGKLSAVRRELESLAARCGVLPPEPRMLVEEVLGSSFAAVEALQEAGEALRQQNEELAVAHNDLEASRRRYRDLFESAPDGYLVTDPAGIVRQANRAALRLLNVHEEALRGQPLEVCVAEEDRDEFRRRLDRVRAGEKPGSEWHLHVRSDDGVFPAALTVSPVRDLQGDLIGLRWLLRNISPSRRAAERERLLEEAQAANSLLRTLLDTMPVGVMVCNAEGSLLMTNPPGEEILGGQIYGRIEQPKRTTYTPLRPDGSPFPTEEMPLVRAMELEETVENVEMLIRHEHGAERTILAGAAPVRDETGEVVSGVAVFQDITARKQAWRERERLAGLVEQERTLLQTVMENTRAHLAYLDVDFTFVMVNSAYAEGAGYSREELIGRNHFEIFPHAENQAIFERVRETGEPVTFHAKPFGFPEQPERGVTYWDWSLVPVKEEGKVRGLAFSLMDVTEQEQARQALRRYADRLRGLHEVDQAILAARSVDEIAEAALTRVPQLLDCVRASVKLYDLEAEEMSLLAVHTGDETRIGKGWRGAIDDEWARRLEDLRRGATVTIEDVQQTPSGSPWQEALREEYVRALVIVPLLIEGKLIGSLNLGMRAPEQLTSGQMDIAQELAIQLAIGIQQARLRERVRRHAQELEERVERRTAALQASQARFRSIFEGAAIGIALVDREGQIVQSNPALQEMLGYGDEALLELDLAALSHPDDRDADVDLYRTLAAEGRDHHTAEKRLVRKDGRVLWANVTLSAAQEAWCQPQFFIAMIEDITERKQVQEALIQTEKLAITGRMAASLAHEINNPLQSAIGCLGLAQESLDEGAGEDARQLFQIVLEELRRTADVVADMRDIHRRSKPMERKPTDVNALLEQVLTLNQKKCENHGVEVIWNREDDLPCLMLAPDRIQQVFLNLALNAVEAMPDGGRLEMSAVRVDDPPGVSVIFADSGVGIGPDGLSHLFDPFYTEKAEGLGLGLFISKNIVENHGGRIEVASQPGEGTTFTVWLPAGD
jgi:PAS domain S-box-containing protein